MTDIIVNVAGVILMAAIIGWFWLSDGQSSDRRKDSRHH